MAHKFRELVVWQRAMSLVTRIYALSSGFPQHELYGLTNQMRRAAVSVALNVAEGAGCESPIEFARFLTIALRSSYETMTALEIAHRLTYCKQDATQPLLDELDQIAAMLMRLAQQQRAKGTREASESYLADTETLNENPSTDY